MIVGLDMGGTHVDAVMIKNGTIINTSKRPINQENLFESIWTTLQDLLSSNEISNIKRINLSTTVSTNAIVEGNISPVAMFIQSGPGLPHHFLACGDENLFLSGYIDHRGRVVQDLDAREVKNSIEMLKNKNINTCGVVTKFSTRNPSHELEIKKILQRDMTHITMGHTLSGKLNFPRRVNTAYLNAAVFETFNNFSHHIQKAMVKEGLNKTPLHVLKADGGTMNIKRAKEMPVETILSGPAASFMGMNAMLGTNKDAILLDIGGTTTDIFFLVGGVPLFEPLGIQIDKYKTLVRAIYSNSIGLGGDSSIEVINGKLNIGPQRKGNPMAFGGSHPTPTDAMIVLGHITEGDQDKAYEAMKLLRKDLHLSEREIAENILSTMAQMVKEKIYELLLEINSQPVYTVKEVLEDQKVEPELINIIGGPAKVLAPILEKEFNLPCHYPEHYHVANAVGAALSQTTTEITLEADTTQKTLTVPELGIHEKINKSYTLDMAREKTLELLVEHAKSLGAAEDMIETEIIEENSFNMVRGFFTSGKNIRVKAQVKPGLIHELEGIDIDA